MPTAFLTDEHGDYVEADPDSDLDYSITSWLEGLNFVTAVWTITPAITAVPYDPTINVAPVTIGGVVYAAGKVATAWIKNLAAGQEYKVNVRGTFTNNRIDDYSFRIRCKNR